MLSESINNFEAIKLKIESYIQVKLDANYANFKMNGNRKIYLDKSSLSKGAWIQYLDDKNVKNNSNGPWKNPQKGIYIVYFDLQSSFIYRGEMLTEDNDKTSFDEELTQIIETIEEEGIRTQYSIELN